MVTSRGKIAIGAALVPLAIAMIGPPLWLTAPLLFVGLFLLVWGIAPQETVNWITKLPASSGFLGYLAKFDNLLENIHKDSGAIDQLATLRSDAISSLLNRPIKDDEELDILQEDYNNWCMAVGELIEGEISLAARLDFDRIGSVMATNYAHAFSEIHNKLLMHLGIKLERLRETIKQHMGPAK